MGNLRGGFLLIPHVCVCLVAIYRPLCSNSIEYGQMFFLPQSMDKTEVGRVKVNRTNANQNRVIKTECILSETE